MTVIRMNWTTKAVTCARSRRLRGVQVIIAQPGVVVVFAVAVAGSKTEFINEDNASHVNHQKTGLDVLLAVFGSPWTPMSLGKTSACNAVKRCQKGCGRRNKATT